MREKIYTIILHDGTQIPNLRLNGNNYISSEEITESMFENNMADVTIVDEETKVSEVHGQMALVQITETKGEYWFVIRDVSEEEMRQAKIRADIDYIAMMTEVDL